jgi:hypothetical protein
MAVDTTARDALLTALEAGTGEADLADFVAWAESVLALTEVNSEMYMELDHFIQAAA